MSESKLETHDDGVQFVMDIFRSMGGTVLPPRRPWPTTYDSVLDLSRNAFLMDFENECLSQNWDHTKGGHPRGARRYEDPEWAEIIKSQVYPHHSDIDWLEYVEWVKNGGGDEWFEERDEWFEESDEESVGDHGDGDSKWTEQRDCNKYTKTWGDQVFRLLDSQPEGLVCK